MKRYQVHTIQNTGLTAKPVFGKVGRYTLERSNGQVVALVFRLPNTQRWFYILPNESGSVPTTAQDLATVPFIWNGPWPTLQIAGRAVWTKFQKQQEKGK